jgi:GT2 family glycosyltransferase
MSKPLFSIVISLASRCRCLEATLQALEMQEFQRSGFECIVVDDESRDEIVESLSRRTWNINVTVLPNERSIGRSMSRNRACQIAQGNLIAFLDADMLPAPDWLQAYESVFRRSPSDVMCGVNYPIATKLSRSDVITELPRLMLVNSLDWTGEFVANHHQQPMSDVQAEPEMNCWNRKELLVASEQYPTSLVRGYLFADANIVVTREALDIAGGFLPLLRKGETLDLGVRIAELGRNFAAAENAKVYQVSHADGENCDWSRHEREAFLYLHPHRSVVMASLFEDGNLEREQLTTRGLFPQGSLDIAATELDPSCAAWCALLANVSPSTVPGRFDYSEDRMIDYFSDITGIDKKRIGDYLNAAVSGGLVVRRSETSTYFDICHTSNWLGTKTRYQEHWFKDGLFGRSHPTPRQLGRHDARPVKIHCRGQCAIEVDMVPGLPWDSVKLNMSIPVEHRCQTNLKLTRFIPSNLEEYFVKGKGLISNVPSTLWLDHGTVSCEFECDISEEILSENPTSGRRGDNGNANDLIKYLHFTFPTSYLEKAKSLLAHILGDQLKDTEMEVKRIYRWIVANLSYASTPLPDYSILDTGVGTCIHLTRLFANLVRLHGLPVREQCGALMERSVSKSDIETVRREHSPFAHTWAEVYFEDGGWRPVELIAVDCNRWGLTPFNVGAELRAAITSQAPQRVEYYFGSVDPYRVYTHHYANKIAPLTVEAANSNRRLFNELLTCVTHRITCSVFPNGDSSNWK